jgi:hypothetical protein
MRYVDLSLVKVMLSMWQEGALKLVSVAIVSYSTGWGGL